MRHALVLGLTLLTAASVAGAEKPIPQDPAKSEKRSRDWLEWNRRTLAGAYDRVGKKDPRWDRPAREAMELSARMFSMQPDPAITLGDIHGPARAAVDAGCDDPLLLYLYQRSCVGPNSPGLDEAIRRMKSAAKALAASRYPAFRRAVAIEKAVSYAVAPKASTRATREEVERDLDAALALLPESVAQDERNEFWERTWIDLISSATQGYRAVGAEAVEASEKVDAKLARSPEANVLRLKVRGHFWNNYGWEARTTAFSDKVPAGGFEKLQTRLVEARKAYTEAWDLRPGDAKTAEALLSIERSIGGDRDNMELWFDRAMKADGNSRTACWEKLEWLKPRWHGTVEEMLAFGRACRETKNWRAGITLLAADAHWVFANLLEPADRKRYLASPAVWPEIKSVCDEYLKHYPKNDFARSKYAALCYSAMKYPEAHAIFEELGDRLTVWPDQPIYRLEDLKGMRKSSAEIVAGKSREGAPPKETSVTKP